MATYILPTLLAAEPELDLQLLIASPFRKLKIALPPALSKLCRLQDAAKPCRFLRPTPDCCGLLPNPLISHRAINGLLVLY